MQVSISMAPMMATLIFVSISASIDLVTRRIPNKLILTGWLCALTMSIFENPIALWEFMYGSAVGMAIFIPFYLLKGIAAGDVKMMMVVGAFVGPFLAVEIALIAFLLGGLVGVFILVCRRQIRLALENLKIILVNHLLCGVLPRGAASSSSIVFPSVGRMPYGPAIALATAVVVLSQ